MNNYKYYVIMFIVMTFVGIFFNRNSINEKVDSIKYSLYMSFFYTL